MMDKSRQQFETYFLNKPQNHIDPLKKDQFGYYYYLVTREAWEAWQASRESLEVELPDIGTNLLACSHEEFIDGFNDAISEIKAILISNGVKIKNE
ncbi:hypothetical protein HBA43_20760 [Providencia rettgeri]|uniref:hypothetical protein n=1 Tax=Providencia TaxID=586 RepID=UPI0014191FF5|nr:MULTISPECIES: hypothetical protein [Providencia]EJD6541451.1 hypothetical protein [Providencia rettgeri]ELR5189156.1 hypothetical protein [Providencia rettgeri]ELT5688894.1 hypothetical protein [Providencia rettgeri]EMB0753503.1 hypothetical protein [Providencia rettgeri]NIA76573.1 hypothetical protein [Providencia rettgeri]